MSLFPGTRLGPYEISAQIGVGGMGEVYRAHDVRLRRDVAIKTSTEPFSDRFEREARSIAALNHPNICTLHDIGPDYLVMELVAGSSPKGPLPVEEVLHIAGQVAAALEAAHERGIVHRDLKPANVKITPSGLIKVLDFGLAKVPREESPDAPTLSMGLTAAGTTLGTPAYMAPEQAQGKDVDKRADVWAFGVLLYELLTGRGPFVADSVQATLVAVLSQEPDWNKVPAHLQRLLRACLKKDPRERLSSIGDWRLLLEKEEEEPRPVTRTRGVMLPWVAAALGLGLGVFGWFRFEKTAGEPSVVRFEVPIPGGVGQQAHFALSADGQHLVVSAPEDGQLRLRVRPLDALEARLLPGGEGARFPFWKPDGKEIGFFADGKLKTIPLAGGSPAIITNVDPVVLGATWNQHGVIVFSQGRELYPVNEKGGAPALLYQGPGIPFEPIFLPDGRHFSYREGGTFVGALDGSPPVRILPDGTKALYSEGHLLFRRQGRLVAQPFDADTLTLRGAGIPVTSENVVTAANTEAFSVAGGVLAYQAPALEQLAWKDRAGTVTEKVGGPQQWRNFRLSPDQSKIALDVSIQGRLDVAVFDLQRGTLERFTSQGGGGLVPVFSPDGTQMAFTSMRTGRFNPYIISAPNQERMIADVGTTGGYPVDWSPDGKYLLYWGDEDLWIVPIDTTKKPYTFARSSFDERDGVFSPDGQWIAYTSIESGRYELYLGPFPEEGGRRYPVSSQGGSGPAWRRDGKELFYVAGDGRLTAVPVTIRGSSAELGRAESLFPVTSGQFHRAYDLSLDGQRVLVATPAAAGGATITVLLNWRRVIEKGQ